MLDQNPEILLLQKLLTTNSLYESIGLYFFDKFRFQPENQMLEGAKAYFINNEQKSFLLRTDEISGNSNFPCVYTHEDPSDYNGNHLIDNLWQSQGPLVDGRYSASIQEPEEYLKLKNQENEWQSNSIAGNSVLRLFIFLVKKQISQVLSVGDGIEHTEESSVRKFIPYYEEEACYGDFPDHLPSLDNLEAIDSINELTEIQFCHIEPQKRYNISNKTNDFYSVELTVTFFNRHKQYC